MNDKIRKLTDEELENVVAGVSEEVAAKKARERTELESFTNMTEEQYDTYLAHSTETKEINSLIKDTMKREKIENSDSELSKMINEVGEKYGIEEQHTK